MEHDLAQLGHIPAQIPGGKLESVTVFTYVELEQLSEEGHPLRNTGQ